MSIIWADFPSGQQGIYGSDTANMLNGIWAQIISEGTGASVVNITDDPDPNIGSAGKVFQTYVAGSPGGRRAARIALPSPSLTEGFGTRLWMASLPSSNTNTPFISFNDASNTTIFAIRILSTGAIEARSNYTNSGTQFGVTTGPVVVANAANHIETKGFCNTSTGTIEVRVNGVVVLNLTGLNTGSAQIAQIIFGAYCAPTAEQTSRCYWKDLIFWDTTGSVGNTFQGSVAVHDLYPDGDISLNWTPSTGSTGYNLIDDTTPNDTDYIQAGDPAPAAYVASLTDLPEDVTSVRALMPIYRAVKTDGGDCNIQVGLTPNNVDWDDGADRPMTTAYTYWWDVSEVSPDTLAPWTPVEVNAAYVRADRTL